MAHEIDNGQRSRFYRHTVKPKQTNKKSLISFNFQPEKYHNGK